MNEKKYYWLKLEENYFDLKVQKALRKLPSGSDMLICYLKMQLKYLNTGGLIEFQGIYDDLSQEIALDIDEEEDLVKMTLSVLEKWRVIEPSEEGFYIAEMQSRIGSKTDVALRVAKHREKQKMLHCNNDVTKCNSIKEKEIEKEIEIEKDNIGSFLESNFGRSISPIEYEKLTGWLEDFDEETVKDAIRLAVENNKKTFSYVNGILNNWKATGEKTINNSNEQPITPSWMDKEIEIQPLTPKEQKEFDDLIANF